MKVKFLAPLCILAMLAFAACTPPSTTTETGNADSTATANADSGKTVVDSSAVAEVPTPPVDSPAVAVDPKKEAAPQENGKLAKPTTDAKPASDMKYRFNVSFISIGSGVDYKAKDKYDAFVLDFAKRNGNVKLKHETSPWGREGEVDYCFSLSELNARQQGAFVQESKALLKDNKLVQFAENVVCKKGRK